MGNFAYRRLAQASALGFPALAIALAAAVVIGICLLLWKRPALAARGPEAESWGAAPAEDDFAAIARIILDGVGGGGNVVSVENCITRLRLEIKDYTLLDERKIKSSGAAGIIRPSRTAVQVIIGTRVQQVADEFKKLI